MACAKNAQQWGIAACGGNGFLGKENSWLCENVCGQTPTQCEAMPLSASILPAWWQVIDTLGGNYEQLMSGVTYEWGNL